jgi:hypothetical protein
LLYRAGCDLTLDLAADEEKILDYWVRHSDSSDPRSVRDAAQLPDDFMTYPKFRAQTSR